MQERVDTSDLESMRKFINHSERVSNEAKNYWYSVGGNFVKSVRPGEIKARQDLNESARLLYSGFSLVQIED